MKCFITGCKNEVDYFIQRSPGIFESESIIDFAKDVFGFNPKQPVCDSHNREVLWRRKVFSLEREYLGTDVTTVIEKTIRKPWNNCQEGK